MLFPSSHPARSIPCRRSGARVLLAALALALPVAAVPPNDPLAFESGELVLLNNALFGISSGNAGLLRIDPVAGTGQVLLGPFTPLNSSYDNLAHDPFRGRLLLAANLGPGGIDLYAIDALGGFQSLGLAGKTVKGLAPTGDGRVYLKVVGELLTGIQYLDAAGSFHVLMDATGLAPFQLDPGQGDLLRAMHYHPGTNSLILASDANGHTCPGGTSQDVNVFRVPLSADGTRVAGPVTCSQFDVHVGSGNEVPEGLGFGPGNELLMVVDTNSNLEQPRMVRIDPVTMATSTFASNGHAFAAATNAGTYSAALGKAVILDTGGDFLRAFGPGESGAGTILPVTGVSTSGSSAEHAVLIQVGPASQASGLSADTSSISLAGGGTQNLSLAVGSAFAGLPYLVLGSVSGWCPGFALDGVHVPLAFDAYTLFTIQSPNSPNLPGSLGVLDPLGTASATLVVPPGSNPALAGLVLHHAAIVISLPTPFVIWATNAVPLTLAS